MNILWVLEIEHQYELRHGATLRYMTFSRGLIARKHHVYWLLENRPGTDRKARNDYLRELKRANCLTDFFEIDACTYPHLTDKLGWLVIHPLARNWLLASAQAKYRESVYKLLNRLSVDICIISRRECLFLLPELSHFSPAIIDWCDSAVLYELRELRLLFKAGEVRQLLCRGKFLIKALIEEAFYGKYATNIVVSKVDKKILDFLNRRPAFNYVLSNGITLSQEDPPQAAKDPNRLIFSGSMDFSPNYKGALWFIDNVMPLLIRNNRDLRLVVAGQEPVPELLAKASENVEVKGLVQSTRAEIAMSQLYVASLISGTGFRNKVIEAIASGTYVIGTPMALEFLNGELLRTLTIVRTAKEFATEIEEYLKDPRAFGDKLIEAIRIVRKEYQWADRIKELEDLCCQVIQRSGGPKS